MELPNWVLEDIRNLPVNFTGQVLVECWTGGVTRRDIIDRRPAPGKPSEHLKSLVAIDRRY